MSSLLQNLGLARKHLLPSHIVLGSIWLAPGSGPHGNGTHPDLGQDNANRVVEAALQAGITEFDTAPFYGAGAAEERLGKAIRTVVSNDTKLTIGTKVGRLFYESDGITPAIKPFGDAQALTTRIGRNDYSAKGVRLSYNHSLERMGLTTVDTLRIHDPNDNSNNSRLSPSNPFVDEVEQALGPGGAVEELWAMRDRGEIRQIGLGMNTNTEAHMGSPEDVLRMLRGVPSNTFDSALLAGGWNLLCQTGWECLQNCRKTSVDVHAAGIFASGYLVDDQKDYAYQKVKSDKLRKRKRQWKDLIAQPKHNYSLPAVAIGFAALPKNVTRLVVGIATIDELNQILEWVEESNDISETLWEEAFELGLWKTGS